MNTPEYLDTEMLEKTAEEIGKALDLKLYYFSGDDTYGFHSLDTGYIVFVNGIAYFQNLEEFFQICLGSRTIKIVDSFTGKYKMVDNIFSGCSSIEEIRIKLDLYDRR